jgi:hypothetical protein
LNWLVFSYSLPSKKASSHRVTLWRRLKRLGAISPKSGVHILPADETCGEALQWLAQEVQQSQGDALIMHVEHFEGLTDPEIMNLFQQARREDYAALELEVAALERSLSLSVENQEWTQQRDHLSKLRRRLLEISQIDFFNCSEGIALNARLSELGHRFSDPLPLPITTADLKAYKNRIWVTRSRPHVDRLACIWLIRRFIDAEAVVRYAHRPNPQEVAFDMSGGAFSHEGDRCTFEVMLCCFGFSDPALAKVSEIVHDIDLRDQKYERPETPGIEAILRGWLQTGFSDQDLEVQGTALFEGLYAALSQKH